MKTQNQLEVLSSKCGSITKGGSQIRLRKKVKEFLHLFSSLTDLRRKEYVIYPIENLVGICFVLALMGKFTSFYGVEQYILLKPGLFVRMGLLKKGQHPSNDTFMRAFAMIDNSEFKEMTIGKMRSFFEKVTKTYEIKGKKIISGDGQFVRGTRIDHPDGSTDQAINILNVYEAGTGIVIGSTIVDSKTNEIPVFQQYLRKMDLEDTIVTMDALHCQTKTAEIIISGKGDYLMKVKDNQPALKEVTLRLFSERKPDSRLEQDGSTYDLILLPEGYISPEWAGARTIVAMVSGKRKGRDGKGPEVQYFLTSLTDSEEIVEAITKRWLIENDLHRFKDVQLGQDLIRVRERKALRNMVTMNNVVYGLYRIVASLEGRTPQQAKIVYGDRPVGLMKKTLPLMMGHEFGNRVKAAMRGARKKTAETK